ncbi:MAG: TRAP transporter permease [Ruminococcaceae bacterium]|nr:TRAP transporter permease [Oscillospiraceae bacterium]
MKDPENINVQSDVNTPIDADALMAEFDRESNTRHFTGKKKIFINILMVFFAVFALCVALLGRFLNKIPFLSTVMVWPGNCAVFLALILLIAYLIYPAYKKQAKRINFIPWYDYVLGILAFLCFMYIAINAREIAIRAININMTDKIVAVLAILLLAEACRRVVGLPILCVIAALVAYTFFQGTTFPRFLQTLVYTKDGITGTPLQICTNYLALFILFGVFLEKTGIGAFFVDLANAIAGFASGGPAKVAVISSAMEGMYSGSSVANTVGSGSITIPTMKKAGYKPEFAAAVEAAASTGGQIMPPIMGAAAFLMSEITEIPYITIAIAAILPALLYFAGIFMMIHFEAKKLGLRGLAKEDIPHLGKLVLRRGYLLLPVVVLVFFMGRGMTPAYSVSLAILTAIIVSFFSKDTRLSPSRFLDALAGGTRSTISVAIACAVAGNVVGLVSLSYLGQELMDLLIIVSGSSLFLALVLVMLACIVLGMGVPTTANYVIMATMAAPLILKIAPGTPVLAAHMFVFYFGIVADITPPVALAAYAGSAIAKSDPLKTGVTATRLAITAFIIPYIFVLQPKMLFIGASVTDVILIVLTSFIGIVAISAGMEGFFRTRMAWYERIIILGAGLCLITPDTVTDIVGIVLVLMAFVWQTYKKSRENMTLR